MKNKQKFILSIVLLVIGLGGGFFVGMKYQQSKSPSFNSSGMGRRFGNGGGNGSGMGFRPVAGEILSMDDKSITVKLPDGSSKIVILTEKQTFSKTSEETKTNLTTGKQIDD